MTRHAGLGATLLALGLGVIAVAVLIFGGLELDILIYVLGGLAVLAVLSRFDVALTWCAVVVFGSIFLFQVATIPTGLKMAFVVLSALLAVWALQSLIKRMPELNARARRGVVLMLWAVGIITVFLGWQIVALLWNRVTIDAWTRDALNYLLIPIAILIGVEAGFRLIPRTVSVMALLAGLVGAYSYTIAWLGRRAAEAGAESQQFGLASSFVVFATLALCLARFASGRFRSVAWLVGALVLMGIMVFAGGRQTIVQCAIALLVAISVGGGGAVAKGARVVTGVALGVFAFVTVLNYSASSADTVAVGRYAFFQNLFTNGFSAITDDQSAQARLRALNWLVQQWQQRPLLGWGFGHDMISVSTGQIATNVFTLDSPLVPLEKFGVIGTAVLVVALVIFFAGLWKFARPTGSHTVFGRAFWLLVTVLTLVTVVNGFPPENRGFPTFLLLTSVIAVSNAAIASRANAALSAQAGVSVLPSDDGPAPGHPSHSAASPPAREFDEPAPHAPVLSRLAGSPVGEPATGAGSAVASLPHLPWADEPDAVAEAPPELAGVRLKP